MELEYDCHLYNIETGTNFAQIQNNKKLDEKVSKSRIYSYTINFTRIEDFMYDLIVT